MTEAEKWEIPSSVLAHRTQPQSNTLSCSTLAQVLLTQHPLSGWPTRGKMLLVVSSCALDTCSTLRAARISTPNE